MRLATIKIVIALLLTGMMSSPASSADLKIFDPDGYYYPINEININGFRIQRLDVSTLEYYYDGKEVHYDKPITHPPSVYVLLAEKNDESGIPFSCKEITIKPEKVLFQCKNTLAGDIIFEGHFIDKRGQYWDYVSDIKTPILKATITGKKENKSIHKNEYTFGYWEGD